MSWDIVAPNEYHIISKRAYDWPETQKIKESADAIVINMNKNIHNLHDEVEITCAVIEYAAHWIVNVSFFGTDSEAFEFLSKWS
jgi:hypothetical protein